MSFAQNALSYARRLPRRVLSALAYVAVAPTDNNWRRGIFYESNAVLFFIAFVVGAFRALLQLHFYDIGNWGRATASPGKG